MTNNSSTWDHLRQHLHTTQLLGSIHSTLGMPLNQGGGS